MVGKIHLGKVLPYTDKLLETFGGNHLEMVMARPLRHYVNTVGAILDLNTLEPCEEFCGLPESLRNLLYDRSDVSAKETTHLGNGWRQTLRHDSTLPKHYTTVGEYHDHFEKQWDELEDSERNELQCLSLEDPETLQKLQESGPVDYCESKLIDIGPTRYSGRKPESYASYTENEDLYAVAPVHEELLRNLVPCDGISMLYFYVWGPKSYSILHVEDALLGSLLKHKGRYPKYWGVIPFSEFSELAALGATIVENALISLTIKFSRSLLLLV